MSFLNAYKLIVMGVCAGTMVVGDGKKKLTPETSAVNDRVR